MAALATSAAAGAVVLSKKQTVADRCPNHQCDDEGWQAVNDGKTFSTIGTVAFAVGVSGAVFATYLFMTSEKNSAVSTLQLRVSPSTVAFEGSF